MLQAPHSNPPSPPNMPGEGEEEGRTPSKSARRGKEVARYGSFYSYSYFYYPVLPLLLLFYFPCPRFYPVTKDPAPGGEGLKRKTRNGSNPPVSKQTD